MYTAICQLLVKPASEVFREVVLATVSHTELWPKKQMIKYTMDPCEVKAQADISGKKDFSASVT